MEITKKFIKSTKGNLSATIHYPETNTEKLAILCSGFLDSKDYAGLTTLANKLTEYGYTTVRFDSTGIWESEGDISDYTTTQYLEDIKSVLDYMLQQVDYKHVLLGGHSRGGQVSILYAAQDPRISIVLGIMPSSGPIDGQRREKWEKTGLSISQRDLPNDRNKKREYKVPFSHVEDSDKYDAVEDVKKIKVPIILIAGELDESVLPEDVKELFDNANDPKTFTIIPNVGHNYRLNDDEVDKVNEYIMRDLKLLI